MALIVQKFGGTSVGNLELLQRVATKILQTKAQGHQVVVVVSAMAGETDRLIDLAKAIQADPDSREYAALVASGEQVSSALLAMALIAQGCPARSFMGIQAGIVTDGQHKKARILNIDNQVLQAELAAGRVPVVAGFQGVSVEGDITTLGRGGSDTTAVALAVALQADECQVYTDVEGIYSADPKVVPKAQLLEQVTFAEMLELAGSGAKVLHQQSVELAGKYHVPLRVLSSFKDGRGTLVNFTHEGTGQPLVAGVAVSRREAKLSIKGLPSNPNVMSEVLHALDGIQVDIDMLSQQAIGANNIDITFALLRDDYTKTATILSRFAEGFTTANVSGNTEVAKLSLVGVGLRSHPAIIGTLFKTLGAAGIIVHLVSASEIKVSILISEKEIEHGACILHTAFGLDTHYT